MMDNFQSRISPEQIESIWRSANESGLLPSATKSVIVHDLERMRSRIAALISAFPAQTLHAIAIKANPVVEILRTAVDSGAGLEAASIEEVRLAVAAGCGAHRIVFDSPAKTESEIAECLELGVHLNVDNFAELARVDESLRSKSSASTIGIRVNPEVAAGAIAQTSVGSAGSKFGVSITSDRDKIVAAFERHPWLVGLHIHVGSQGCDLDLLCLAAKKIEALREHIQRATGRKISLIDIGGGLPAAYNDGDQPPTAQQYSDQLASEVPELMSDDTKLMTEFGRSLHAGCGVALSRVEYVRNESSSEPMAVIHLGADFLLRPVYRSNDWSHQFVLLDSQGRLKNGAKKPVTIAGPLCFAGDILARQVDLSQPEPGDWIAIRDCGAYTLSMWSRHCNRGIPAVVGYLGEQPMKVLRHEESADDVVRFWSH
ncbi:diaminopimelate decarboxylase [Planctomycetes bacterium K23_9]|uniref:Diaminopimelate decarboxylase n=1 Tax=Stieleria marina TaxID=1930275 RepID=A0A517P2V5_9BACT|nr:Diaminopimelate decarboxylase [Planctomycetes bacterium K23_9]